MNKVIKTILIISIAVFGAGVLVVPAAQATEMLSLVIEFEQDPLFNEANFLPGDSVPRWVKVTNNTGETQPIATEAINYPNPVPANDLSRALDIVIREKAGADLYGGSTGEKTLFNFYEDGETYLSDVTTGNFEEYEFEISFPSEKENDWQGATTTFDILVGSQGTEGNGGNGDNGGGGNGGGGGLPPGLTISAVRTIDCCETTAKITWTTSYFSTSQVIYSAEGEPHNLDLGASNYGYQYSEEGDDSGSEKVTSHNVTLTGLSPTTAYYLRCVSHASLPTISLEYNFTTPERGTCYAFEEPIGEEEEEEEIVYLGEEEEEEEEEEELPVLAPGEEEEEEEEEEVIVAEVEEEEGLELTGFLAAIGTFFGSANFCWLFFTLILILTALFLLSLKRSEKYKTKKRWIWPLAILALVVLYCIFCCSNCWLLILIISIMILLTLLLVKKKEEKNIPPETQW